MKYWDVLRVQENFVKVFSEEVDRERKDLWKTFIPHEHFKNLFKNTMRILESEGHIWLHGAYGTGKTHGAFVIKHLLEDPWEEIEDFLGSESFTENERNLLKRVRNNGKILVVYKDGANEVTNSRILMNVVSDSIHRKLRRVVKDPQDIVESLREKIANLMVDWDEFVKKYHKGEFSSGEELKMAILNEEVSLDLLSRVLENLMNEGMGMKFFDVDELRSFIRDIVGKTEYKRILFIWDEFTSFFDNSNPPIEYFQRIIQEIRKPLHFIVINHKAPEQFRGEIKSDLEKIKDRFLVISYEMKEPTAAELISRARKIVDKTEFDKITYRYFSRYDREMLELMENVLEIDDERFFNRFKHIFPIHPYSMRILVDIVHNIGSSQRSLFEFLFDDKGFKGFLKEYPKNGWEVLTLDKLWEYFFLEGNVEKSARYVNHFKSFENRLNEDEKKVLASILTLLYFKEEIMGYYRVNFEIMKEVYVGTPLFSKLSEVIESLKEKHALIEIADEYTIYRDSGDVEVKPEELLEDENIVEELEVRLLDKLSKGESIKNRLNLVVTSWKKAISSKLTKLLGKLENHEVGIVVVFPSEGKRLDDVKDVFKIPERTIVVVVGKPLEEVWDRLEYLAKMYKSAKIKGESTGVYLREIVKKFEDEYIKGDLNYILVDEKGAKNVWSDRSLKEEIAEFIRRIFPVSFEIVEKVPNAPLWKSDSVKKSVITKILKGTYSPSRQDRKFYELLIDEWRIVDSKWNLVEDCPEYIPICRMRNVIRKIFEEKEEVSFNEIWNVLSSPPFGLYKSLGTYIILAVLMKEYLEYHYSDGKEEGPLYPEKFADMIVKTLKGDLKNFILKKLNTAQRYFMRFTKEVFLIGKEVNSIQKTIDLLRTRIKVIGYPIWILKHNLGLMEFSDVFEILGKILRDYSQNNPMKNEMDELFEKLGRDTLEFEVKIDNLRSKKLYQREPYSKAFEDLLASKGLKGYNLEKIQIALERKMQEDVYRWDEERFNEILNFLVEDIRFAEKLKEILGVRESDLIFSKEVVEYFRSNLEFPLWLYEYHPDLRFNQGLRKLMDLLKNPTKRDIDLRFISRESVKRVFEDPISALKEKIKMIYPDEDDETVVELAEIVISEMKGNVKKMDENHLKLVLERAHEKIGTEKLKRELKAKIEKLLGTDLKDYLKNIGLSVAILDEKKIDILKNLMNLDELSKSQLTELSEDLDDFLDWLTNLDRNSIESMYRSYISSYDESAKSLSNEDFREFLKYLFSKFDVLKLNASNIFRIYREWFESYYENHVKPVLLRDIRKLGDKVLSLILDEITKDPNLGFKVYRIIREMISDETLG